MASPGPPVPVCDPMRSSVPCILLLVERGPSPHRALNKALLLARHFGARLELLLCETRCARATRNSSAAGLTGTDYITEGERYLQALRQTIISPGVEVGTEVVCAPSLARGLAEKLQRSSVQMVVRSAPAVPGPIGRLEWHLLLERCSVPLLLTAGRPWRATPRFAAALDLSEHADEYAEGQIVGLAEALAGHCSAELDYLCAAPMQGEAGRAASDAHRRLCALLPAGTTGLGRLWYFGGEPARVLPRLIARRDYDLLALGVVSNHSREECGGLIATLLEASAGDVMLVPGEMDAARQAGTPQAEVRAG
jgi:hypothetical protein